MFEIGDKVVYINKEKDFHVLFYNYLTFGIEYKIIDILGNKVKVISNTEQIVSCPMSFFVTSDEYNIYLREDKILKIKDRINYESRKSYYKGI